jgi:hypothetical protein
MARLQLLSAWPPFPKLTVNSFNNIVAFAQNAPLFSTASWHSAKSPFIINTIVGLISKIGTGRLVDGPEPWGWESLTPCKPARSPLCSSGRTNLGRCLYLFHLPPLPAILAYPSPNTLASQCSLHCCACQAKSWAEYWRVLALRAWVRYQASRSPGISHHYGEYIELRSQLDFAFHVD